MNWMLGPFRKLDEVNPVLESDGRALWDCPVRGEVSWEEKDVFNPAAVVKNGMVNLLYRAEDRVGRHMGTSRIGLATSPDGISFHRHRDPVLFPAKDDYAKWEWEGGCEDPRVATMPGGGFVLTYTAFDGDKARLCVANSPDLKRWTKHGPAFPEMPGLWSKAGSVVCRLVGDQLVAEEIGGKYWMYWGESSIFAATSRDLIHWEPVRNLDPAGPAIARTAPPGMAMAPAIGTAFASADIGVEVAESEALLACMRPRRGRFDSELVEPGPPAVLTPDGIVLLYNGKNLAEGGDASLPAATYCVGQALFDPLDPTALISRSMEPCLRPDREYETAGQVGNVCFAEGLAWFQERWWLYYGTADSKIAVAVAEPA